MSKPAIIPETTASGIAVDPRTLERVVPESRRPDGSVRKELKIRPGYTPQEDVRRFRGTRQAQMDATALPKGHIIGWTPPPPAAPAPASKAGMSKAQKKNEKRKEKRKEKKEVEKVKDNWDDDSDAEGGVASKREGTHSAKDPDSAAPPDAKKEDTEGLVDKLNQLEVR